MTRFVLPLLALSAIACDPPEAKDRDTVWTNLQMAEGGEGAIAAIEVNAGVDAEARDMDTSLGIDLSGIYEVEASPQLELAVLEGFDAVASESTSDGTISVDLTPDFARCDGLAYTVREDGGCDYTSLVLIAGDQPYSVIVGFALKTQAPEEWAGDPDSLDVYIETNVLQAEQ